MQNEYKLGVKFRTHGVVYDSLIRPMHAQKVMFEFVSEVTLLSIIGSRFISYLPMLSLGGDLVPFSQADAARWQ
ncbi:hypothetical protein [Anaplasma phagocytophilum]|uniref:Uncharacterized protein n=3 Tax=Anaplasma phagocytophilum TaxID=948 RepID=A0A168HG01_ANAPH|nr:hypothetical protein [Anaplasma phagocytophilum]ANC34517.1 hypothetical protein P029_04190 [Anaplasma phagocytophilum str. Norway variant2]